MATLLSKPHRLWGAQALAPEPHWLRRQRHDITPPTIPAVPDLVFTDHERLALAGFLAGYRGLTREATNGHGPVFFAGSDVPSPACRWPGTGGMVDHKPRNSRRQQRGRFTTEATAGRDGVGGAHGEKSCRESQREKLWPLGPDPEAREVLDGVASSSWPSAHVRSPPRLPFVPQRWPHEGQQLVDHARGHGAVADEQAKP